jgi:hypothetical protein
MRPRGIRIINLDYPIEFSSIERLELEDNSITLDNYVIYLPNIVWRPHLRYPKKEDVSALKRRIRTLIMFYRHRIPYHNFDGTMAINREIRDKYGILIDRLIRMEDINPSLATWGLGSTPYAIDIISGYFSLLNWLYKKSGLYDEIASYAVATYNTLSDRLDMISRWMLWEAVNGHVDEDFERLYNNLIDNRSESIIDLTNILNRGSGSGEHLVLGIYVATEVNI